MTSVNAGLAHDIAIIGGGAAGALVALQLLRQATRPLRIALMEPHPLIARGIAYATPFPAHVLNVPARRMSAFDDQPEDFLDFIAGDDVAGRERLAPAFVERHVYGDYLQRRLQQAIEISVAEFEIIPHAVHAFVRDGDELHLRLENDRVVSARACVIAVGNRPRPLPARGAISLAANQLVSAWDFDAMRAIPAEAHLCIVGSGLSMVDTVLSLVAKGHRGVIEVMSRHGLRPLAHASVHASADFDIEPVLAMTLRERVRFLRRQSVIAMAAGLPWQAVMERLRPHGQRLWQSLTADDQRRFLRHVVRLWDVHRHRIAGEVDATLQGLIDRGQLRFRRARLDTVMPSGRCVRVATISRTGERLAFDVDHVINATGVELRVEAMRNPLLSQLLDEGHAQAGPHGIGIATDDDDCLLDAQGRPQADIRVIGSLRIGTLWETIAIPELRGQAERIARALLAGE